MCSAPDIPEPQQLQASKEPVTSGGTGDKARRTGRRGTILAGGDSGMSAPSVAGKKTLLGT